MNNNVSMQLQFNFVVTVVAGFSSDFMVW